MKIQSLTRDHLCSEHWERTYFFLVIGNELLKIHSNLSFCLFGYTQNDVQAKAKVVFIDSITLHIDATKLDVRMILNDKSAKVTVPAIKAAAETCHQLPHSYCNKRLISSAPYGISAICCMRWKWFQNSFQFFFGKPHIHF